MTNAELEELTKKIDTAIVQAPDDIVNGSGTIYRKLNEFRAEHGSEWMLLRAPVVLDDGSLLAILVRMDN